MRCKVSNLRSLHEAHHPQVALLFLAIMVLLLLSIFLTFKVTRQF